MTYHLINKAVMKQNWIEALNQHAQPLKKKAALIIIVIIRIRTCAQVSQLASVLQCRGVVKGDRVLIYMPMIAEAIVTMLACARLGAVHSLVFGGFASKELATRINHAQVGPRRNRTLKTQDQNFLGPNALENSVWYFSVVTFGPSFSGPAFSVVLSERRIVHRTVSICSRKFWKYWNFLLILRPGGWRQPSQFLVVPVA